MLRTVASCSAVLAHDNRKPYALGMCQTAECMLEGLQQSKLACLEACGKALHDVHYVTCRLSPAKAERAVHLMKAACSGDERVPLLLLIANMLVLDAKRPSRMAASEAHTDRRVPPSWDACFKFRWVG